MKRILLLLIILIFSISAHSSDRFTEEDFKKFRSGELQITTEIECNKLYEEVIRDQIMDITLKWDNDKHICKINSSLPLAKKYKKQKN